MHIDAGKLTKRIQFLMPLSERDADGYPIAAGEKVVRETWAQYSQTSGTELVRAGAEFGEAKVRFLTRYYADIQDRRLTIRYDGRDYDILYLNAYGDEKAYTEYWCERHTQEGTV